MILIYMQGENSTFHFKCAFQGVIEQLYDKNQKYSEVATQLIWLSYLTVEGEAVPQYLPKPFQYLFVNF